MSQKGREILREASLKLMEDNRQAIFMSDLPNVEWIEFVDGLLDQLANMAAPTEVFQQGYESAIEDMIIGTIPLWVVGLLDEVEFMGQEPERHGIYVRGPFTKIDVARAYARTMSTDPDEAVIVPVKAQ